MRSYEASSDNTSIPRLLVRDALGADALRLGDREASTQLMCHWVAEVHREERADEEEEQEAHASGGHLPHLGSVVAVGTASHRQPVAARVGALEPPVGELVRHDDAEADCTERLQHQRNGHEVVAGPRVSVRDAQHRVGEHHRDHHERHVEIPVVAQQVEHQLAGGLHV